MGTLWTPGGERDVSPEPSPAPGGPVGGDEEIDPETAAALKARMEEVRNEVVNTPAPVMVTNHLLGLYELGAIYLSAEPPKLGDAKLAIDALGAIVESIGDQLPDSSTVQDMLSQLRLAYVQVSSAATPGSDPSAGEVTES